MVQTACKLTLVYPIAVESRIIEIVMESSVAGSGFTTWAAEGHGQDFAKASLQERVRGRVRRGVLVAIMTCAEAELLLAEVAEKAPLPHLAYWMEPVIAFGRMAPEPDAAEPEAAEPQADAGHADSAAAAGTAGQQAAHAAPAAEAHAAPAAEVPAKTAQ